MSDSFIAPTVDGPDSEGFLTFGVFHSPGNETTRVSFHLDRLRESFGETSTDTEHYGPLELERLKLAARVVAARDTFEGHDRDEALQTILEVWPTFAIEVFEKYFAAFMQLAVKAVEDVLIKHTLNIVVRSKGAPKMYDDRMLQEIFREMMSASAEFLALGPGRPEETEEHIRNVEKAITKMRDNETLKLWRGKPTQTGVAKELNISQRRLREWHESIGLSWNEYLRACGWSD